MNGPVRRISIGIFTSFCVLLLAVTWIQVVHADTLKADPRNARPALSERGKERGLIVTIDGTVVAESVVDPADPRSFVRTYPEGEAFAHVVGYNSFLLGDSGLEEAYASVLRSKRDLTISDLLSVILGRDLRPHSLEMTVNGPLQRAAYEALAGQAGAVVALDPKTGAVLAAVSSPSFDPESLLGEDAQEMWDSLLADPESPLSDRVTKELFAPGSTFKTVVTATALDTGEADPGTEFPDPLEYELEGSTGTISNYGGGYCDDGTTVTLLVAFVRSCNTIFADLSVRLGAEDIGITAGALGFNTDLNFPWTVPQATYPVDDLVDDPAALAQSGIGERDVRATPLHMAMIASAVANQGLVPNPYLVNRVFDADGDTVETTEPVSLGRAMAPATASVLAQMMERVVTEGTGRLAAVPGVRVAGKTGTAEGAGDGPHAWFIGFAPVENPTIAIAVLIAGGGDIGESATGGAVAAPIAADLISLWLQGSQ
ncbi:MAG TPA: penicillin-binding transpeptidase domain-containing protein [Acidimicrobiia bacterium]|nr:penicillin-binding transpeptidase domain-containing protein [Acidimicrobiia bacterium]